MTNKKFSVMTRTPSFFYSTLNRFGNRSFLTLGFMASMPQDFEPNFKFLDIFVFLVPVEILSQYPNIDSYNWI